MVAVCFDLVSRVIEVSNKTSVAAVSILAFEISLRLKAFLNWQDKASIVMLLGCNTTA